MKSNDAVATERVLATVTEYSPITGLAGSREPIRRRASDLVGFFYDHDALQKTIADADPVIYEYYDMRVPATSGDVAYGTSITYPGKVGSEYFMTKGHYHNVRDTAEIYYCLRGEGILLMENEAGHTQFGEMRAGTAVYVPRGYAHRTVNTSSTEALVTFFAFPGHAGHDYASIEETGFSKICVDGNGSPTLVDNPRRR